MKIGLIDVDGYNFPNIPLMKWSAWHKRQGDSVEWYSPMTSKGIDKVYMSKVFGFSPDYAYPIYADEIIKGGSGYCIDVIDGKEVFDKSKDNYLPYEVEHIYPDYSIYGITDTAYGFLTRGCPRGCDFCHVATKEGKRSYKVADLKEFWRDQPNICLCDPNIMASRDCMELFGQLIESKAFVEFNQGLDVRFMTEKKAEMLKQMKIKKIHFAWDRYQDKDIILEKLNLFKEIFGVDRKKVSIYVLSNFDTTIEQDLERCYTIRDMGYAPYLMIYNKDELPKGHIIRKMQRYVNNRIIFYACDSFEDYMKSQSEKGQLDFFQEVT